MPSQTSTTKSALDPINLLVIAATIVITCLPFTIAMVIQKTTGARADSPVNHINAPEPSEAPILRETASR